MHVGSNHYFLLSLTLPVPYSILLAAFSSTCRHRLGWDPLPDEFFSSRTRQKLSSTKDRWGQRHKYSHFSPFVWDGSEVYSVQNEALAGPVEPCWLPSRPHFLLIYTVSRDCLPDGRELLES